MTSRTFVCATEAETMELGRRIGRNLSSGSLVSLTGPLGAGKTVIAKGIAQAMNITEAVVSPTFTLVQEYEGDMDLHHLDLYRINGAEDFEGIGGEELLYEKGVTLIEWSEKIAELLPSHTIFIAISINDTQERLIEVKGMNL
ncbi:MAG: tRNA (adenosine(37)-N6)-threonylcarbamoyltransferase complex ATPase subunit type 1 TsaE [Sphaerochaetaceae bacterium]|nr:tRNA (adenosine(37)-N6)-threonylcarbamoyltransferase complex ATPase subunit type 1 TsaE [Sphaerochaetaceae bacterium]